MIEVLLFLAGMFFGAGIVMFNMGALIRWNNEDHE